MDRWKEWETALAVKRYHEKVPLAEIARELGRSTKSVSEKLRRIGTSGTMERWDEADITKAMEMAMSNIPLRDIGKELGRSHTAVKVLLCRVRSLER